MQKNLSPLTRTLGLTLMALALVAVAPVQTAQAQDRAPMLLLEPDPAQGWEKDAAGVWSRSLAEGGIQTEYRGVQGMDAMLDELNAQLVRLVDAYLANPTDELATTMDAHLAFIRQVETGVVSADTGSDGPAGLATRAAPECKVTYDADCGSRSECVNYASADVSYTGSSAEECFGECNIYTYAYVDKTTCNDTLYTSSQSCNDTGINISCSASASLAQNGLKGCNTSSQAYIYCPDIDWGQSETCSGQHCGQFCLHCADSPKE